MHKSQCQDCGKIWTEDQLEEITHGIWERVAPGEPMPSGECPECHALCQPYEEPEKRQTFLEPIIHEHSPGAMRAGKNISDRFRRALPHLPATNASTLAEIIDRETCSPELLEQLRRVTALLEVNSESEIARNRCRQARAAIAKAEGKV